MPIKSFFFITSGGVVSSLNWVWLDGLDFDSDVSLEEEDTDEDVAGVETDGGDACVEYCALVADYCEEKCLLCEYFCWKQPCLMPFKESIYELCLHRLPFG